MNKSNTFCKFRPTDPGWGWKKRTKKKWLDFKCETKMFNSSHSQHLGCSGLSPSQSSRTAAESLKRHMSHLSSCAWKSGWSLNVQLILKITLARSSNNAWAAIVMHDCYTQLQLFICPSIFYTRIIQFRVARGLESIPAAIGRDGSPGWVASPSQGHTETNNHAHSLLWSI